MSSATSTILVWLFVINLGIAFGAGLYEHRIVVSKWISNSPESGAHWNAEAVRQDDTGRRFWEFVTTVPLTSAHPGKSVRSMAGSWCRSWLVACGSIYGPGRPTVHLFLFHSDHGEADENDRFTGIGGNRNTVVESELCAPLDRPCSVARLLENIFAVLSTTLIA